MEKITSFDVKRFCQDGMGRPKFSKKRIKKIQQKLIEKSKMKSFEI